MGFRIGTAEITFSFWFFAVIALFASVNADILVLCLALPVILHELAHFIAIPLCGAKIKSVRFTAFGVEIEKSKSVEVSVIKEAVISLAGVFANLLSALLLYMFAFQSMRMMLLISANLAVGIFNLLPVGNLDGGELARILSNYFFKPRLAYALSRIFSFLTLSPLFAASIYLLLRPERNFTLLAVCLYLLVDIIVTA